MQITRLRLGGTDINNHADLLEHFRVCEIIDLGDKFVQWLRRSQVVAEDCIEQVEQILQGTVSKQEKALGLCKAFFPQEIDYDRSLKTIVLGYTNEEKAQFYSSLLNCIAPTTVFAIELMRKVPFLEGLAEWLTGCEEKGRQDTDFCFEYGKYLKSQGSENEASEWMKKAKQLGHREAAKFLEGTKISVKGYEIEMVHIGDETGFYIAKCVIPIKVFQILGIVNKWEHTSNREECDKLLHLLCDITGYKWTYPTRKQWEAARSKIVITEDTHKHGEWLIHRGDNLTLNYYQIAGCQSKTEKYYTENSNLRPILEISENPQLL